MQSLTCALKFFLKTSKPEFIHEYLLKPNQYSHMCSKEGVADILSVLKHSKILPQEFSSLSVFLSHTGHV